MNQTTVIDAALESRCTRKPSRVSCTVDFDADGKQFGHMTVPHSRDDSAWGSIQIPIIALKNGTGPTLLFTAGSHGDEYEGPIALMNLARALDPADLSGRVLIVPTLNLPAVRGATRLSPIDGRNMNRVFPGNPDGTVTEVIADYVFRTLVPLANVVVDLHSGGKTLSFVPSAVMHHLEDQGLMDRTAAALKCFGAPIGLILRELDNQGMLDTAVEALGKVFISTELGGNGTASAHSVAIADRGVRNLLYHFGVLGGGPVLPAAVGDPPTRMMTTPEAGCVTMCADAGILEMAVDLGTEVKAGDLIGRVHLFEDPESEPVPYHAEISGMLWCRHMPGLIQRGDCMAVIAVDLP